MPRIRTVKPEFWADEKISKLPRDARLLFIGLFNFADDAGRMRGNPLLIRAQVFPYDADVDSESLLRTLAESSLIFRYEVAQESYIWIRNFNKHQKIDKPTDSVLPGPETKERQTRSTKAPRKVAEDSALERKGKEGNGSGKGIEILPPQETAAAVKPTVETARAYIEAFKSRWEASPFQDDKPDATANGVLARIVKKLGQEEAPLVAAYFLTTNDRLYVNAKHPLELLLRDGPKLRAEWAGARKSTATDARLLDRSQSNAQGWLDTAEIMIAKEKKHGVV